MKLINTGEKDVIRTEIAIRYFVALMEGVNVDGYENAGRSQKRAWRDEVR